MDVAGERHEGPGGDPRPEAGPCEPDAAWTPGPSPDVPDGSLARGDEVAVRDEEPLPAPEPPSASVMPYGLPGLLLMSVLVAAAGATLLMPEMPERARASAYARAIPGAAPSLALPEPAPGRLPLRVEAAVLVGTAEGARLVPAPETALAGGAPTEVAALPPEDAAPVPPPAALAAFPPPMAAATQEPPPARAAFPPEVPPRRAPAPVPVPLPVSLPAPSPVPDAKARPSGPAVPLRDAARPTPRRRPPAPDMREAALPTRPAPPAGAVPAPAGAGTGGRGARPWPAVPPADRARLHPGAQARAVRPSPDRGGESLRRPPRVAGEARGFRLPASLRPEEP